MAELRDDIVRQVEQLKGHVTKKEYAEAVDRLKALGGEMGAFAAMHAALAGAAAGASAGIGWAMASMNPIGVCITFTAGVGVVTTAYLFAADKLNDWYGELDTEDRVALTKVIAFGIAKSTLLLKMWKMISK
ncbi:hypothetical protein [Streptomyces abikoensis]|uniref:Uncharacterized protein n=1 Tax=Streptomyces abikoensis TaxID=97398 RepID=A0ABW7SW93_9ACTN